MNPSTKLPRALSLIAALLITGAFAGQAHAATLNIGSQSTGAGAGKVTFNPF